MKPLLWSFPAPRRAAATTRQQRRGGCGPTPAKPPHGAVEAFWGLLAYKRRYVVMPMPKNSPFVSSGPPLGWEPGFPPYPPSEYRGVALPVLVVKQGEITGKPLIKFKDAPVWTSPDVPGLAMAAHVWAVAHEHQYPAAAKALEALYLKDIRQLR